MIIEDVQIIYNIKSICHSLSLPNMIISAVIDDEFCKVFLSKTEKNIKPWNVICGFDSKGHELDKEQLESQLLNHPQLRIHLLLA